MYRKNKVNKQMKNKESKSNDEEIIDTKKVICMFIIAIVLFFAGFAFLIWAAVMQEHGLSNKIIILVGILGFLGCDILSIVLLIKAYPGLLFLDIEKIDRKCNESELLELPLMEKEAVVKKLLQYKFKHTEEGCYRKKKFSFLKDYIYYYVRIVDDIDLENAVRRELNRLDSAERKGKNFCLLLFVYLDELGEAEKKNIKEIAKRFIALETINPHTEETIVVVAIDSGTNTGYLLDVEKGKSLMLYSYGYKMLKKFLTDKTIFTK